MGEGAYTPQGTMSLAEKIAVLRIQNKELTRANKRLQEENEFLSEAGVFLPRAVGSQQKREIKVHNKQD